MKYLLSILCLFVLSCDELTAPIFDCTDDTACNYNKDASNDDGTCTYAEENFDCDGNCIINEGCD